MEKDIGKITKNDQTDIVVRVDDFGGKTGLTIREFVSSDRYTGFTKSGVRIPAEEFPKFKEMINSVTEEDMKQDPNAVVEKKEFKKPSAKAQKSLNNEEMPDY
jgi:hypothetical protein